MSGVSTKPQPDTSAVTADPKREWIARVLGIAMAPAQPIGPSQQSETAANEIAAGMQSLTMAFRKARLEWSAARGTARKAIADLQKALRETLADEPDFPELNANISKFNSIMRTLDDTLEAKLDEAMNATDPKLRETLKQQAQKLVADHISFVEGHPYMRKIDDNDVFPVQVFSVLSDQLARMSKELDPK